MAYELVSHIDKGRFDCKVLCFGKKADTPLESLMEKTCPVEYVGHSGRITTSAMLRVFKRISAFNPDIIHAHMGSVAFAAPWCIIHNKPFVVTAHTTPEKAFSRKNEMLIRAALRMHKMRLVAVSEDNYKRIVDYYGIHDQRITYVNNGIDTNKYYRSEHDRFTFINVGRHDKNKNQAAIIEAFKRIHDENKNTMLYLIGDGPCHGILLNQITDLDLSDSVIVPGITGSPEGYYAKADVYVQSSHREAMPLSVLEAMAAGLPIISTDVGGLKDVVKTNGILVPDNDAEALFAAMRQIMLASEEQYDKMSQASIAIASQYSSAAMANSYMKIYEEILGQV